MFALMHSECLGCGKVFAYNPKHVPSLPVDGVKEPICLSCVETANQERSDKGVEPFVIHPNAYAPIDADQLVK